MKMDDEKKYRLIVVTRPRAGLGFRLAGVHVEEIEEADATERLTTLLRQSDLGAVAVEEEILRQVPEATVARAVRSGVPVVIPIALPSNWSEAVSAETYVAELVRRAIGYHIKIDA